MSRHLDEKFLETQEQKDRLQQNMALIKMEEGIILRQVLKLQRWFKLELLLTSFILCGAVTLLILKFFI